MEQPKQFSRYTTLSAQEVCVALKTPATDGLTDQEVKKRRNEFGSNTFTTEKSTFLHLIIYQFKSPFFYLFFIIGLIYLGIGEYTNALIIAIIIAINFFLTLYEEYRASHTIALLKSYLKSYVTVLRNGKQERILSEDLVPGDVLLLHIGDKVPADCRFIASELLSLDESSLTGESNPVEKTHEPIQETNTILEAVNIGFAGTVVSRGQATAVIFATGTHTEFAHIAALAQNDVRESSLAENTAQLASYIIRFVLVVIVIVFILRLIIPGQHSTIMELFIFSTALAISIIPEALPLVTIVCLAQGAFQLTQLGIIVKRLSAIEDLGTMNLLCTDKTGTLTENIMIVQAIYPEQTRDALYYASLTLEENQDTKNKHAKGFETALWQTLSQEEKDAIGDVTIVDEESFDPTIKRVLTLIKKNNEHILITRGAPENVFTVSSLSSQERTAAENWIHQQEQEGHRVLAIAKKNITKIPNILKNEKDFTFVGLISFEDPIKKTAFNAVKKAHALGVKIKLLSGDSPYVCESVARALGIMSAEEHALLGDDFDAQSEQEQRASAEHYAVFARFTPEQKYKLISYLEKQYAVGYVGDGINDAPALKLAHVGLTVDKAVDIARDAADIILLKKNLAAIIEGIQQGRIVFLNTMKYIFITIVANIGNFFSIIVGLFFLDYIPLLPIQLLIVNLLSDFPMIMISTDTVSKYELQKIPHYNIYTILRTILFLGILSSSFDCLFFVVFKKQPMNVFRTAWFVYSILSEIVLIFSLRTQQPFYRGTRPSYMLIFLSVLVALVTIIIPFTWIGNYTLQFVPISTINMIYIIGFAIAFFVANEIAKRFVFTKKCIKKILD